jgi:tetratricopeptide (TPR) repeat protein
LQREAVRIDPLLAAAWFELGNSLEDGGFLDEAIAAFRKAIGVDPGFFEANCNLGTLFGRLGFYEQAEAALREAIRLAPDFADGHANLAVNLEQTGRFREALEVMQRARDLGASRPTWRFESGAFIRHMEELIRVDEKHWAEVEARWQGVERVEEMLMLADMASFKRRWALAAKMYGAALARDPSANHDSAERRTRAARALIQAASAVGVDSRTGPGESERARMRAQALAWMQEIVRMQRDLLEGGEVGKAHVRSTLSLLLGDAFFASVREESELRKLPAEEARTWREHWKSVRDAMP